nr:zinc finger protein 121-like [Leptinotarsa decemlineata]
MESIRDLNLNKICRVCLYECDNMFSLYSELFEDNNDDKMLTIFEILANLSTIKVESNDVFPTMICTKCINSAHSAYKFQQQCNRSQMLLDSYMNQMNDLKEAEVPMSTKNKTNVEKRNQESYSDESPKVQSPQSEFLPESDLLSSELVFINDEIMKNDGTEDPGEDDCDDLRNCIPLGEDTVDQLIKDNLQVDNLELISPKMRSFNLDLKAMNKLEVADNSSPEKVGKEQPNMKYYIKEKDDSTVEYECNVCQKSFMTASCLKNHLKHHDDVRPYVCTECKKAFKVYGSLMHHTRSHSGEQPYKCKECGKKYKQSGTLKAHMRIHSGSKPFICSICSKGFRQAPDLTYHMRTHTKEKPYMCNVCGKTMSMQWHLVQHMRSHTGEKPFKCNECDKAFPSSTRLKRHSIIHTTLKPFKCNTCGKSFNRSSSLQVHKKTHVGIKSHFCSTCNKSFLWAHSLRAHVALHAKESTESRTEVSSDVIHNEDLSPVEFNTMTIYSNPSENSVTNESFTVFSSVDEKASSDSLKICAIGTSKDLKTFTLYSADSNFNQVTSLTSVQ